MVNATHGCRVGNTVLAGLALALVSACGSGADDEAPSWDDDLLRARAAGAFTPGSQQNLEAAWAAIAPLVERPDPAAEDLIRAAIIAFADTNDPSSLERTRGFLDRAESLDPEEPALLFVRGNLASRELDFERAAEHFRALLALDPDDAPTHMKLGETLEALDQVEAASDEWRWIRAQGLAANSAFYSSATYHLGMLLLRTSETDAGVARGRELIAEKQALDAAEVGGAGPSDIEMVSYGAVQPPAARRVSVAAPTAAADFAYGVSAGLEVSLEGATRATAWDLDDDGRADLVGAGPSGSWYALQASDGSFASTAFIPARTLALGDLDDSDILSALHHPEPEAVGVADAEPGTAGNEAQLFSFAGGPAGFMDPFETLAPSGDTHGAVFVDFDHDGDLDLALATETGVRLYRNDGSAGGVQRILVEATPDALASVAGAQGVLAEDLDADQDVDLLVVHDGGVTVCSNLRGGEFSDVTTAWGLTGLAVPGDDPARLVIADLDHDLLPDLLVAGRDGVVWYRRSPSGYEAAASIAMAGGPPAAVHLADLDLDGHFDLIGADDQGTGAWPGPLVRRSGPLERVPLTPVNGALDAADMNGDGIPDVLVTADGVAHVLTGTGIAPGVSVRLSGKKDNTHGVGCVVESWAKGAHTRLYARGRPLLMPAPVEVAYITWPNGVLQREYDLAAGTRELEQVEGLAGSCPFLYTWNGERFTFVTDVLGTTPLGLPMTPDVQVPFDHEEYVKIRGDQLRPDAEGRLRLALTEELREVTYLDRARLHAIDHSAGVEIEPNEGFVFPPFPEHHVHTFSDVVAPARITAHLLGDAGDPSAARDASAGEDVTERLGAVDGRHAQVFVPRPAQFYGLAEPWALDIELGRTEAERAAIAAAPRLRLVLTGWLRWTDASVNVAAARHPTYAFEPPLLWVPDGDDWRAAGPPIGFPAGKTKSLVVDITGLVDRDDPRLRLTTSLALTWDAVRLCLDDDDAPYVDTPLEPLTAEVGFRGLSAPLTDGTGELPDRFDWDLVAPPRWDQHPGRYTRYGDVRALVAEVDDRLVVFGVGDVVQLEFDASSLPPLPAGWVRDWLLYLDGWAKDRDPNTEGATEVEPLPFHGMTRYPPPPGEPRPDTPAHRAWIEEFQTREALRLIVPLAVRHGTAISRAPDTR